METYIIIGLTIVFLLVLMLVKGAIDSDRYMKKRISEAKKAFGTVSTKRLSLDEMEAVKKLFYRYKTEDSIDDLTASDIDLDEIFQSYDNCLSAPGREYFYNLLRNPLYDEKALLEVENNVSFFNDNEDYRDKIRAYFLSIGNMKKVSFFDCLDYFDDLECPNLFKEYAVLLVFILSIALIFISEGLGIALLIFSVCFNILDYYKERGKIENYMICFNFIANFIDKAGEISKIDSSLKITEVEKLGKMHENLKKVVKYSSAIKNGSGQIGAGNPFDLLFDYVKMLFHIDIILFYRMLDFIKKNKAEIEDMYLCLGKIETYINIVSIRKSLPVYCIPKKGEGISFENIFHPLIRDPVKNSLTADEGVLITGSNASGKSTFLKSVAINLLFSKTIHTCLADSFVSDDYHLFSSMSLRDDVKTNDSYFMVEIKALKRIFDFKENNPDKKVICFVDEVLRGTNTIERIAACTQILLNLKEKSVLCFAATHDYELTDLLEKDYLNYHFSEDIKDNDILFEYKLIPGKATSRNAIKLLSIMGFNDTIVNKAQTMASDFSNNGVWRLS